MNKKIKVIRIITRLNIGGPAIHTILLNEGLDKKGFDTRLITGALDEDEGDMSYLAKEKGISVTVVPHLQRRVRPWLDVVALWKIYRIIKEERPDIVHTHTAKAGTIGRCAAIFNGVPVRLHTFHGHVFQDYFKPEVTKVFILIEKMLALFTDRILVVSGIIKSDICGRFKILRDDKVTVIKLGLDLDRFRNSAMMKGQFRKELGVGQDLLLIGMAGRLTAIKNHKMLFEAVRLLKTENPELKARFVIIGDGELRQELEALAAKLNIKDMLVFTGWRRDMPRIYADLDISVLTSLNEGTPVTLIESMASAKAVVSTRVGGVPDIIKEGWTGLLVDSGNEAQLKDAILRLCTDAKARLDMGRRASADAYENYSKERLVNDMEKLYKELLSKKTANRGGEYS